MNNETERLISMCESSAEMWASAQGNSPKASKYFQDIANHLRAQQARIAALEAENEHLGEQDEIWDVENARLWSRIAEIEKELRDAERDGAAQEARADYNAATMRELEQTINAALEHCAIGNIELAAHVLSEVLNDE